MVRALLTENRKLKDEVALLKKCPARPKLRPSKIGESEKKSSSKKQKPKSSKSKKIEIHNVVKLHPDELPQGAKLLYYKDYLVQDITIKPNNTKYRIAVYRLPDGTLQIAKLPKRVDAHFGAELKAKILYLYYKSHMTQPLILELLTEHGIQISSAQISRILTKGHNSFHEEKEAILKKGMEVSRFLVCDDTGYRHKGRNGYCTHIGNDLFAYFESSYRKSRLNFLKFFVLVKNLTI